MGKVVVYYNTVRKVLRIIEALGYNIYYYYIVEKDSMLVDFIEEK